MALSDPQPVSGYATIGVTWQHGTDYEDDQLAVQVRTEKKGAWSDWMTVAYHDDHGPDGGSTEEEARNERPGTDALVIGDVDQVQMRAETVNGIAPPDLKLAVIDPGKGTLVKQAPAIDTSKLPAPAATDTAPASASVPSSSSTGEESASLSAMQVAPKPYIFSRAQWGANEKLREQTAPSYGTVKAGFIHHTVNANNYTSAQVPALLRGIYAYHTQSRGWRDIGYNYLVDRFGRIWEGRYGGVTRAVVGAHTLGYNEVSFAMSAIGNFDIAQPPQQVLNAYAALFAWKLSLYNIRADAPSVWVKNRYLHAINGHRDVGQTACPGRYLYAKIPSIRTAAQLLQNRAQTGTTAPTVPKPPAQPPAQPTPNAQGFLSPTQAARAATPQPATVAFPRALNLVGDAAPEVVVKTKTGPAHVLQLGGQTGYKSPVSTPGSWSGMDQIVAVGDVTGDGRGDVLARWRASKITRIYRGDGAGHVLKPGVAATARFAKANMITAAGDWNRDGRNDLLTRDAKGRLRVVLGLGGGTFGKARLLSKGWKGYTSTAVTGDLTGDGRPDVVGLRGNGYVYLIANSRKRLKAPLSKTYVGRAYSTVQGGGRDLTGDGYGDVVLRSGQTGRIVILTGHWRGFGATALGPFDEARGLSRLSGGQMSGGARPDVVGTNAAGNRLVVVANNDLTNISAPLPSNLYAADATQVLNVGDWNKDGHGDVITRQSAGDFLRLWPGLGNGKFGPSVGMGHGWKTFTNLAAVGDVTGDKLPDLVGRTVTGKTTIFPGNGGRSFKAPVLAPATLRSYNLVGTGSWQPQLMPGSAFVSSDGSFVPFIRAGVGDPSAYNWVIGPGDVNGDRRNDLVVRDGAGRLWLLPGTATGLGPRRLISTGFGGYTLGG